MPLLHCLFLGLKTCGFVMKSKHFTANLFYIFSSLSTEKYPPPSLNKVGGGGGGGAKLL